VAAPLLLLLPLRLLLFPMLLPMRLWQTAANKCCC
jgi:hypothetical protein